MGRHSRPEDLAGFTEPVVVGRDWSEPFNAQPPLTASEDFARTEPRPPQTPPPPTPPQPQPLPVPSEPLPTQPQKIAHARRHGGQHRPTPYPRTNA
jgi:hypothetical protein